MDGNGNMNYRNWSFYDPPAVISGHLGLELMPGGHDKPLSGGRHPIMINNNNNTFGPYHHMPTGNGLFNHRVGGLSESSMPIDFVSESWINSRERCFNNVPSSQYHDHSRYSLLPESSGGQEMLQHTDSPNDEEEGFNQMDEIDMERNVMGPAKKRQGGKMLNDPKAKKSKKGGRSPNDDGSVSVRARVPKKSMEIVINGMDMDLSSIPIPICSCTGAPQQCYRWGSGGWQSACCTMGMSVYPLPMSTKRRGARIAGRKMSIGAFKKVLEKLASEGYNFAHPIDLRTHWAKHGTNKFVTIR